MDNSIKYKNLQSIKEDETLEQISIICSEYSKDPTIINRYTEESVRRMYHFLVGTINELKGTIDTLNIVPYKDAMIDINSCVETYAISKNYDDETVPHNLFFSVLINKELDNIKLMLSIVSMIISTHFPKSFTIDNPYNPYQPLRYRLH